MPDPFTKAKMTGDLHPPEVESELPLEEGSVNAAGARRTPAGRSQEAASGRQARPGRGVKKAGLLRDHDEGSDRGSETPRESDRHTGG